jgi:hypothetical protein
MEKVLSDVYRWLKGNIGDLDPEEFSCLLNLQLDNGIQLTHLQQYRSTQITQTWSSSLQEMKQLIGSRTNFETCLKATLHNTAVERTTAVHESNHGAVKVMEHVDNSLDPEFWDTKGNKLAASLLRRALLIHVF